MRVRAETGSHFLKNQLSEDAEGHEGMHRLSPTARRRPQHLCWTGRESPHASNPVDSHVKNSLLAAEISPLTALQKSASVSVDSFNCKGLNITLFILVFVEV